MRLCGVLSVGCLGKDHSRRVSRRRQAWLFCWTRGYVSELTTTSFKGCVGNLIVAFALCVVISQGVYDIFRYSTYKTFLQAQRTHPAFLVILYAVCAGTHASSMRHDAGERNAGVPFCELMWNCCMVIGRQVRGFGCFLFFLRALYARNTARCETFWCSLYTVWRTVHYSDGDY